MELLRTPDERFEHLPDFPFAPTYSTITHGDGTPIRIHAVDEGPRSAAPILLLHGEPSWSYLYRKMIPGLTAAGHRVVAPDLVGFGRTDKPADPAVYTYEQHVRWLSDWFEASGLTGVTLFAQDWGGLLGLRLVAAMPERFARVIVANTGLPVGTGWTEGFKKWLDFSQSVPVLPVGKIVSGGTVRKLTAEEVAAYDAPFPDERYKAGARRFPALVPITPEHDSVAENRAAWEALERFERPFLTAFGDSDPITKGGERVFQERIPGAKGRPHTTVANAAHFLQEDAPEALVAVIDGFVRAG